MDVSMYKFICKSRNTKFLASFAEKCLLGILNHYVTPNDIFTAYLQLIYTKK